MFCGLDLTEENYKLLEPMSLAQLIDFRRTGRGGSSTKDPVALNSSSDFSRHAKSSSTARFEPLGTFIYLFIPS